MSTICKLVNRLVNISLIKKRKIDHNDIEHDHKNETDNPQYITGSLRTFSPSFSSSGTNVNFLSFSFSFSHNTLSHGTCFVIIIEPSIAKKRELRETVIQAKTNANISHITAANSEVSKVVNKIK